MRQELRKILKGASSEEGEARAKRGSALQEESDQAGHRPPGSEGKSSFMSVEIHGLDGPLTICEPLSETTENF